MPDTYNPYGILISGDQAGLVTEGVYITAGSGEYLPGAILMADGSTGKYTRLTTSGTPYAILSEPVDAANAADGDIAVTVYRTGQFTESVMESANDGLDLETFKPALRTLNIHIQPDVA